MQNRIIFHIDLNSAFLSWEAAFRMQHLGSRLDLRTIPSAVGGDVSKRRGIILAKSIPAKKYHIQTGEPITEALRKCPELMIVPADYELYEKNSKAFMDILRQYSDKVEPYSIDEAFVDMTGTQLLFGPPVVAAAAVKDEIRRTLGFTVNVGISDKKLLAKMASDFEKPDRVHTLFSKDIQEKMWPLPIRDLFLVGSASEKKLKSAGIRTIGDLAATDLKTLRALLKKHGEILWNFANGHDLSLVEPVMPDLKGYGNSTTVSFDVVDASTAKLVLLSLAETVGRRLRKDHASIRLVSVSIRYYDFSFVSHQSVLKAPTNITKEIHTCACRLFDELWNGMPIRHMGMHTGHVSKDPANRQLSLFDHTDYEKLEKLDQAVDRIRDKYGSDAVFRASFLGQDNLPHMNGGIPKERRTADRKSF